MNSNTAIYPFWNPATSGKARDFANPVGVATATLAAALLESTVLRVPYETAENNNFLRMMQYAPSAGRIPGPQMPAATPMIPTPNDLLSQAYASLLASTGAK